MTEHNGNSIFDAIDDREKTLDRYSAQNVQAFINTLDFQPLIRRAVNNLCEMVRTRLLNNMEYLNIAEGACAFRHMVLTGTEYHDLFIRLKEYFGFPEKDKIPEDLRHTLYSRWLCGGTPYDCFSLWRKESRYSDPEHHDRFDRYTLTSLGEQVLAAARKQLSEEAITIVPSGPELRNDGFDEAITEYLPLGGWASVLETVEMSRPVICFQAEPKLVRYAIEKGILKEDSLSTAGDGWKTLRFREKGPEDPRDYKSNSLSLKSLHEILEEDQINQLEMPSEDDPDDFAKQRKQGFLDEETLQKMESFADNQTVLPTDDMTRLSEEERLLLIYREKHKLCIFCGSSEHKKGFLRNYDSCAKCKKPWKYY